MESDRVQEQDFMKTSSPETTNISTSKSNDNQITTEDGAKEPQGNKQLSEDTILKMTAESQSNKINRVKDSMRSNENDLQEAIIDNILSPPKSETTQTDDTSSSPASDSQLSPTPPVTLETGRIADNSVTMESGLGPINIVANGSIPKSGKPMHMSVMNKKSSKPRQRKQKPLVAMYESEISDNKIGIKLCIKKADTSSCLTTNVTGSSSTVSSPLKSNTRKRSRKSKSKPRQDSDSDYETKRKNIATSGQKKVSFDNVPVNEKASDEPLEQSVWGSRLPEPVLLKILEYAVDKEGCFPTLCRVSRVCSLWYRVSVTPRLWRTMDLSTWIKEKHRNEYKLKWLVDNRCKGCTDLNVSNWKVSDINCFLSKLAFGAPNLNGITLSGWKGFSSDHLAFLVNNLSKLGRIDLSSLNTEMNTNKTAVGVNSICYALKVMSGRLTHLYLAHNRLAGIPQIVNTLTTYCPNLLLLDLSNVTTQATSHGVLYIEKLQNSCQKLRVLRVTNSHITIAAATLQEKMDSPGFPDLEELSVAALTDESRVFGDDHLQRILKTSSKLKLLDVRGCGRLTHESLIRLPAWEVKHLFLSGCAVTRDSGSGLELIASKWSSSLIELDLAWSNMQPSLDNALRAFVEKGNEAPLAHLNLCGSSVSEEAVKAVLANCPQMSSINLASCRGLPRGVKREMSGPQQLQELRDALKVVMKVKLPTKWKDEQEHQKKGDDDGGGKVTIEEDF